jgi:hypothetical protein
MAGWQHRGEWAFDGYNWKEGDIHQHGQDVLQRGRKGVHETD